MLPFPEEWRVGLVLVAHPDDPEYGIGAAVAKWTASGKTVHYVLASRGEAGIAGMPPEQAGPVREGEQRRSAAIVGVDDVVFWDFPDSNIRDTTEMRSRIAETVTAIRPDLVITGFGGPNWGPGMPNQRDHIEFAQAVAAAYDTMPDPPAWLFENAPNPTHAEVVEGYLDRAVDSLAAHEEYLSALDPETPVPLQARTQVEMSTVVRPELGGRCAGFVLKRRR